ncbi:MAG: DUF1987 domain-containing protein [Bacteroidales bacterium]|nr:DUF1987 domain-containing protein [Bacteroidales bacterium]
MRNIKIPKTQLSPRVILDKDNKIFEISGKSAVENAEDFYKPILDWFTGYFKTPNENTEIIFYLEYLNSSSSVQIGQLLNLFEMNKRESHITVNWFCETDDETMTEVGTEFKSMFEIQFNLKLIKEDSDNFQLGTY